MLLGNHSLSSLRALGSTRRTAPSCSMMLTMCLRTESRVPRSCTKSRSPTRMNLPRARLSATFSRRGAGSTSQSSRLPRVNVDMDHWGSPSVSEKMTTSTSDPWYRWPVEIVSRSRSRARSRAVVPPVLVEQPAHGRTDGRVHAVLCAQHGHVGDVLTRAHRPRDAPHLVDVPLEPLADGGRGAGGDRRQLHKVAGEDDLALRSRSGQYVIRHQRPARLVDDDDVERCLLYTSDA